MPIYRIFSCLITLSIGFQVFAQSDTLAPVVEPPININVIENYIEDTNEDAAFDFNTAFEEVETYAKSKLDINKASAEDLSDLLVLNDLQIQSLIKYREKLGDFISVHELQAVPNFDLEIIRQILPFVETKSGIDDIQLGLLQMAKQGSNELYLRWGRFVEEQKGYRIPDDPESNYFLGDPNRLYVRYYKNFENKMTFGFTAEKDPGEEFFKGSNTQGFDFYSFHFYLKDYNRFLKSLAIGDFTASFGQGLILYSGFGRGKSIEVLKIKRNRRIIKKYSSVNEANFLRGAAATFAFGKHIEFTALASVRRQDGNLVDISELDEPEVEPFTSLQNSGNHRTRSEIFDEGAVKETTTGGSIQFKKDNFKIGFNGLYGRFDRDFERNTLPYSQFFFSGNSILNLSADYSWVYKNINFFGETARSDNGAVATINGLIAALDRNIHVSILHRYFPVDYQALNPNPLSETGGARNENGIYMGIEVRPTNRWTFKGYFDIYRHPWLRFSADAPSSGYEIRGQLIYKIKRKLTAFVEVRNEVKLVNTLNNTTNIDFLSNAQLFQTKIQLSFKANKAIEIRNRVHFGFFENEGTERLGGIMLYQDLIYKPINIPFSLTARFAIFDTEDSRIRFYVFENNLLNVQSIPGLFGQGTRYYLNLRYRGIRNVTLEARIAQSRFSNQETVGSGLNEIQGNKRTEVAAQIKLKF